MNINQPISPPGASSTCAGNQDVPQAPRSNGWRCRVIRAATAKEGFFAITVNDVETIGVIVGVDLERGASGSKVLAATGGNHHGR